MSDRFGLVTAGRRAGLAGLASALGELARTWLPVVRPDRPLLEQLATVVAHWPDTDGPRPRPPGPVMYPMLYRDRLRVTPSQFCEITDAAHEAARAGASLLLVAIPMGRSGGRLARGVSTARLADCWQAVGLPVLGAPGLVELPDAAGQLVDHARINGFARRSMDLPDLLVAAAAGCLHTSAVYLPRGIARRRGLERIPCLSPLSSLCGPDPFADPPPAAKLRPAGSDPVWFLAFTTGRTGTVGLAEEDREPTRQALRARMGRCWNLLRAAAATTSDTAPISEPIRLRLATPPGYDGPPPTRAVLPLFGSPRVGEATRMLLRAASLAVGELDVVVDDLSPRYLYRAFDPTDAKRRWHDATADLPVTLRFLGDQDPVQLAEELADSLVRLRGADLLAAAPDGLAVRARGRYTGYDAIHLATMAVAAASSVPTTLVVRGSSLGAALRFGPLTPLAGLLVATGLDTETVPRGPVSLQVDSVGPHGVALLRREPGQVMAA